MKNQEVKQTTQKKPQIPKEFNQRKSETSSHAADTDGHPDEQNEDQAPRANEIYEETLPPESRVVSQETE